LINHQCQKIHIIKKFVLEKHLVLYYTNPSALDAVICVQNSQFEYAASMG